MSKRKAHHDTSSSVDEEDSEVESLSAEEEEEVEKTKDKNDKKRKKPSIKKAGSAYTFYMKDRQAKIKEENPELSFGQISTKVGIEWKAMSDEEKKPYTKLAEEDKKRFDREKAESPELFEKGGSNKKQKKKKNEKDPNAPKKNKNSYMFFSQEIRPKVIEELGPEMSKKVTVVQQVVGTRWKQLSPEEKTPYEEMAKKDKERYTKELEEYNKNK